MVFNCVYYYITVSVLYKYQPPTSPAILSTCKFFIICFQITPLSALLIFHTAAWKKKKKAGAICIVFHQWFIQSNLRV